MNRYIKAMEIGLAHEETGISYRDLVNKVENGLGYKFDLKTEATFYYWFVDNFSAMNQEVKLTSGWKSSFHNYLNLKHEVEIAADHVKKQAEYQRERFSTVKWYLNGEASKQYLDFVELAESRIAATQARKQSNISIIIAIGAVFVSTLLGAYSIFTNPNPPYDVKVIENNSRVGELEQQIQQLQADTKKLKDKLYEAEMLISTYESEN